jgi:4-methyl-5(b-hydroxyethyl)-thiazole monophosphate biosynthesis
MRLMVPFADGFEEIEAFSVMSVLRGAGIGVDMVGVVGSVITGAHGVRVMMDKRLSSVKADDYDGVVLPGGGHACATLGKSKVIIDIIKKFNERSKLVAAICYAPRLLMQAGILNNRKATIYPGLEKELSYPRGDRVVVDGNIITSQGPGTSIEFALAIVEFLIGREKANALREGLVV